MVNRCDFGELCQICIVLLLCKLLFFSYDGDSPSSSLEIIKLLALEISGPHPTLFSIYFTGVGEDKILSFSLFLWKLLFH